MCTGVGRRSFLTTQPYTEGTVLHRAPNLVWPGGQLLGMTWSDWLSQHLGVVGPKCVVTGGGATGRMHSKPQGFSTQLTAQPAHQHVSSQLVIFSLHSNTMRALGHNTCGARRGVKGGCNVLGHLDIIPEGRSEHMMRNDEHIAQGGQMHLNQWSRG